MSLRRLILLLLLLSPLSFAAAAEPVHVVKFINFSCSVCRASELLDAPIRAAVTQRGGRFVVAPLPPGLEEARERFYYALRDLGPEIEAEVRMSLYRGAQDLNYPLSDVAQTLDWLRSDMPSAESIDWIRVLEDVNGFKAGAAVERAVDLAIRAGVQIVPVYVLVQGNRILATIDTTSVPGGQLSGLREAVLQALQQQNNAF